MQSEILSSYATAQYLLVLEPHEHIRNEISSLKKKFAEKFGCTAAVIGKPNITLVRFEQYEMMEPRILRRLQSLTAEQNSFVVELHDFGSFPSHSIFINVTTQSQIIELVKSLRPIQHLFKIDKERKPHFITDPNINIARKLLPWQYEKGWLEMSHTHFSGRFMVDHLLLLRKREGEKTFETVRKFKLLNERVEIVQSELFS